MSCFVRVYCVDIALFMCISGSLSDFNITGVVPGDYDGDSQMDVLITGYQKELPGEKVFIFWGRNQTLGKVLKIKQRNRRKCFLYITLAPVGSFIQYFCLNWRSYSYRNYTSAVICTVNVICSLTDQSGKVGLNRTFDDQPLVME